MNANGSEQTQLTFGSGYETDSSWSPNCLWITYVSNAVPGSQGTHIAVMDRWGLVSRNLTVDVGAYRHPKFSPDGTQILFSKRVGETETQLFAVGINGGEPRYLPMPLPGTGNDVVSLDQPTWAPDGRSIAFWVWRGRDRSIPNDGNIFRAAPDGQDLQMLTIRCRSQPKPRVVAGWNTSRVLRPAPGRGGCFPHRRCGWQVTTGHFRLGGWCQPRVVHGW